MKLFFAGMIFTASTIYLVGAFSGSECDRFDDRCKRQSFTTFFVCNKAEGFFVRNGKNEKTCARANAELDYAEGRSE